MISISVSIYRHTFTKLITLYRKLSYLLSGEAMVVRLGVERCKAFLELDFFEDLLRMLALFRISHMSSIDR